MSNIKKVILFVSIIAVLVTSFMLPTFADEVVFVDSFVDNINNEPWSWKVFEFSLNNYVPSGTNSFYYRLQQWNPQPKLYNNTTYYTLCLANFKLKNGTEVTHVIGGATRNTYSYLEIYGSYSSSSKSYVIRCGTASSYSGTPTFENARISVNFTTGLYSIYDSNDVVIQTYNITDVESVQYRYYFHDLRAFTCSNSTRNSLSDACSMYRFIDYHNDKPIVQEYYDKGLQSGIDQGYQSGYDEGYQEGFASAGGSFADIVSNPEVGIGLPDISIDFADSPISHMLPNNLEKLTVLARFDNVDGQILRLANDENLLTGNHSIVLDWLGNDEGDPPTFKGYRMVVYNSDGTVHGTLWYSIEALDDGSLVAADAWYWFPNYYMNGSLGVAPYRVHDIRIDAWVHGDSTAILESKPLTDDGFVITYPYMGEQFYTDGYDRGYGNGLKDGFDGADTSQAWMNLKDTIFVIFDAPFYVISQSLNFDLFGINIAGAIIAIISVSLIVFILKIIIVRLF